MSPRNEKLLMHMISQLFVIKFGKEGLDKLMDRVDK